MKKILLVSLLLFFVAIGVSAQEYSFGYDMQVGSSGTDVAALQSWLIANGYDIPAISSGITLKGYFGLQTKLAVQKFQFVNGIPNTGYVGPLTRGKLNSWNKNKNSIRVLNPNGGEELVVDDTYEIKWESTATSSHQVVNIYLAKNLSGCFNLKPGMVCLAVVDSQIEIAKGIQNLGSYIWTVKGMDPAGSSSNYYIRICRGTEKNMNSCDTSDNTFKILENGTNPVNHLNVLVPSTNVATEFGLKQLIKWEDSSPSNQKFDIYLASIPQCPAGMYCQSAVNCMPGQNCIVPVTVIAELYKDFIGREVVWDIGKDRKGKSIKTGDYYIKICRSGTTECVTTKKIELRDLITADLPDINIVSPNGGEKLRVGSTANVNVSVTGKLGGINHDVSLWLASSTRSEKTPITSLNIGSTTGMKTFSFKVPNLIGEQYVYVELTYMPISNCTPPKLCMSSPEMRAYDFSDRKVLFDIYPDF